jgi:hypothetical protein
MRQPLPAPWLLALTPTAWLLPNHYPPWVSAWLDGAAMALLALAALFVPRAGPVRLPRAWGAAALVAAASVVAQWATGRMLFAGDAWMVLLYVGAFVVALALGDAVVRGQGDGPVRLRDDAVSAVALGFAAAAALCVALALIQWTGVGMPREWVADLPPGARPYSNLAQPNHFSTATVLGVVALAVLREGGRIGPTGFWAGATFLLLGMVMSGSRTGWLQLGLAAGLCAWFGRRLALAVGLRQVVALVAIAAVVQAVWSPLDQLLDRGVDRPLDEKLAGGARPALWRDSLAAVAREPLLGHGWQQIGAALQSVALDRAPESSFFEHFDHSHNIVLDLLLWAGIPVGGAIVWLGLAALSGQLRRLADRRAVWLVVGALAIVLHALLEFPHTFAYFLIPLGLLLGMAHALSAPHGAWALPGWTPRAAGVVLAAALALVGADYLQAEENFRLARLETARIGTSRVGTEVPPLRVLTQLEAYLRFVRTEARAGLSEAELRWMGQVALRHGYAPVLFRYALALGLNGRPQEAARTLQLLCHVHSRRRCNEAREAWPALQARHAALRAVPAP